MKYSPEIYAEAFAGALDGVTLENEKKALENFVRLIAENGDLARTTQITAAIEKIIARGEKAHIVEIESARELSLKSQAHLRTFVKKDDVVRFSIRPELIAGFRVTIDGEREYSNALTSTLRKLFV